METPQDMVELRIPRKPEYVSVARLAVSGLASRLDFSYDEVEDIKTAVGEACTTAIQETGSEFSSSPIIVRCESDDNGVRIEVIDQRGARRKRAEEESAEPPISRLLMEVLMDEVEVSEDDDGSVRVCMTKHAMREEA